MKHIRQFSIILLISFLGDLLNRIIPLPIPASIYGLIIMLLALHLKIVKMDQVQDTAEFFVGIMSVMFIPAAVKLIDLWSPLKEIFLPLIFITVVSTIFVMVVSGHMTQLIIQLEKRRGK